MPNLPVGGLDSLMHLEGGRLTFGFSFAYAYRDTRQTGDARVANPMNARTEARIYTIEAAAGLWRGLSLRVGLPVLEAAYEEDGTRGYDADLGDLWVKLGYAHRWVAGKGRGVLRLGGELGASFPTGGRMAAELQPNAGFASHTVNPLLHVDLSYDLRFGLGFFVSADARLVPYGAEQEMDHGGVVMTHVVRSGSAFTYGAGLRYRLWDSLVPSAGLFALHRLPDRMAGEDVPDTGVHALYVSLGLSYAFTWNPLRGLSLFASVLVPVYQRVRGTQLAEALNLVVGLRFGFQAWNRAPPAAPPPLPPVADRLF